jgi:hypothetical protein
MGDGRWELGVGVCRKNLLFLRWYSLLPYSLTPLLPYSLTPLPQCFDFYSLWTYPGDLGNMAIDGYLANLGWIVMVKIHFDSH